VFADVNTSVLIDRRNMARIRQMDSQGGANKSQFTGRPVRLLRRRRTAAVARTQRLV
jgi:hypothetical protein